MTTEQAYIEVLNEIKESVLHSRIKTIQTVNSELVKLYWNIGKLIVERQYELGWGKAVVDRLANDLQKELPNKKGFSSRNLWDMRRLYERYQSEPKLRQLVAEIPWGHNLLIMNKVSNNNEAIYYIKASKEFGWSRNVLLNQIKANLYHRSLSSVCL